MLFKTCSCHKDEEICIVTGFVFSHNNLTRTGDLFLCERHGTLSIHGVNVVPLMMFAEDFVSTYAGILTAIGVDCCSHSLSNGLIDLNEPDVEYIANYRDITKYAVLKGE